MENPKSEVRNPKLLVIVGSTASGKSILAVQLAKKFEGEVVSADSRQVYKGLDIGSGKITKKEMMGVPHHCLDVTSPKRKFTVSQYRSRAIAAMAAIAQQGKLPILVGGSPFYIYSVTDGWTIPEVKPNPLLRRKLERLSVDELFSKLKKLDPQRAKSIESKNPRRLIRALEIVLTTKKPIPQLKKQSLPYPVLFLGIKKSKSKIQKLIVQRLTKRFKQGMIQEVATLHKQGLSWKRLEELGLEYRFIAQYLQRKLSLAEMKQKLQKASVDFARRQMTWFKKDKRIHWIKNYREAVSIINSQRP
ncbi:MAG: tRNA (adenosine(37)-N6)-dimethylallyltransferase MiaA [Candidatus Wildermuthbacteria bacterium]|nr:tRNA (adenosine(37)-N6)-dimethylallyltransferase MiaA [Candidatus Wildermuthbacteria bacterium]